MPGTYSQILLHVVFSTKHREPWITPDIAERLYPYMGGIVRAEKGVLYDIGGVEDHVHMYLQWRPDATISDLMRTVKARSSKWVHDTFPKLGAFAWQEGYSVFTVSKSQEGAVKAYSPLDGHHIARHGRTSRQARRGELVRGAEEVPQVRGLPARQSWQAAADVLVSPNRQRVAIMRVLELAAERHRLHAAGAKV